MSSDIVVVGSGIAASAAILSLKQQGLSVTQIAPPEKSSDKIGETLSCSANRILKELKLWEGFLERGYLAHDLVFSAWEEPTLSQQSRFSPTEGSNWSIDRRDFEDFLRAQSNNGYHERLFNQIRHCSSVEKGIQLELDNKQTLNVKYVIDCSGRASVIGGRLSPRHRIDNMLCYHSFMQQIDIEIEPTVGIMIEAVNNGWWYSAVLPDGRMIVSFYTYSDFVYPHLNRDLQAWQLTIDQAPLTSQRILSAGYSANNAPLVSDAGMLIQTKVSGEHWIIAGDALATLDPLSSHGMTHALWSGWRAAEVAAQSIGGDHSGVEKYKQTIKDAMQAYQTELIQKYQSVYRFAEYPFWQRRVSLPFQTVNVFEKIEI